MPLQKTINNHNQGILSLSNNNNKYLMGDMNDDKENIYNQSNLLKKGSPSSITF